MSHRRADSSPTGPTDTLAHSLKSVAEEVTALATEVTTDAAAQPARNALSTVIEMRARFIRAHLARSSGQPPWRPAYFIRGA